MSTVIIWWETASIFFYLILRSKMTWWIRNKYSKKNAEFLQKKNARLKKKTTNKRQRICLNNRIFRKNYYFLRFYQYLLVSINDDWMVLSSVTFVISKSLVKEFEFAEFILLWYSKNCFVLANSHFFISKRNSVKMRALIRWLFTNRMK